jgi:hypothetical protein
MSLHDITAPTSIISPLEYANVITGQWFGGFIVLFIFMVTFICLKRYKTESALLVAGVITFICVTLMIPLQIVSPIVFGIPIVIIIVGIFMSFWN